MAFDDTTPVRSPLFEAIPIRQCGRSIYNGHPVAATDLRALEEAAHGDGVPKSENDKGAKQLRSSAGVMVFVSDANDQAHWIEGGRCYERFALQATALGIRMAFLNQPVEVATVRSQFATWLNRGAPGPDLVVRFGRGPEMPRSLRRPIEQVLA